MTTLLRKPSAWIPMVLPLVALALILGFVARFGVVESEDEGAGARIFQLLMLLEAGAIAFFAIRWLPVSRRPAAAVVALQIVLAAIPVAAIVVLET